MTEIYPVLEARRAMVPLLGMAPAADSSKGGDSRARGPGFDTTVTGGSDESAPSCWRNRLDTCLGPYRIRAFLSSGGMGEVYRAVDERLDRMVAIKVLPQHLCLDPRRRRRLRDEARLLSAISHPHICTLYDIGHSDGVDFLVMEYLTGRTLAERLAAGPMPIDEALSIGSQLASALEVAHRAGIVHRDLKPANVMLTGQGESRPLVKLLDFGLARAIEDVEVDGGEHPGEEDPADEDPGEEDPGECTTKVDTRSIEGTLPYMAPEQLGAGGIDRRTDVWALGVILYEMVCGRRPFRGPTTAALVTSILRSSPEAPSKVNADCSRQLGAVIERCLERDASKRWPSCAEVANRIEGTSSARSLRVVGDGSPLGCSAAAQAAGLRRRAVRRAGGGAGGVRGRPSFHRTTRATS